MSLRLTRDWRLEATMACLPQIAWDPSSVGSWDTMLSPVSDQLCYPLRETNLQVPVAPEKEARENKRPPSIWGPLTHAF